jgi:hypothetical protein
LKGASSKQELRERLRHVAYAGGWKKFEPLWDWVIRAKRVTALLPMLETVLTGFGSHPSGVEPNQNTETCGNPRTVGGEPPRSIAAARQRGLVVLQAK